MTAPLVIAAFAAAAATCVGTYVLRARAQAWGLMDVPNERSLHVRATPRGGGILIVLAFLVTLVIAAAADAVPVTSRVVAFMAAASIVAVVGWLDDLHSLPAAIRLLAHLLAASVLVTAWGTFARIALPGGVEVSLTLALSTTITILWIVGLLNAYNFMDGIDGLASGQAVVGGLTWLVASGGALPLSAAVGALIAAASLGFLWHNWSPARIFMGDAGSGFLGFSFAALPLLAYHGSADPRFAVVGLVIVAPFVFDALYTFCRRLLRRENVMRAHRSHLYQRLVIAGWSHAAVASLFICIAVLCGAAAVLWLRGAPPTVLAVPGGVLLLLPLMIRAVEVGNGRARASG